MTDADTPDWHVLGPQIRETTSLAESGTGLDYVYEVPYRIDSGPAAGHQGMVRIAKRDYTPAAVEALIRAETGTTHGVAGLRSGSA